MKITGGVIEVPLELLRLEQGTDFVVLSWKSPADGGRAGAYRKMNSDDTHPYRQKELICKVNEKLKGKARVNSYDILVIRRIYEINGKSEFVYQSKFGSIQYSDVFAQWITDKYEMNSDFFTDTRAEVYRRNH